MNDRLGEMNNRLGDVNDRLGDMEVRLTAIEDCVTRQFADIKLSIKANASMGNLFQFSVRTHRATAALAKDSKLLKSARFLFSGLTFFLDRW